MTKNFKDDIALPQNSSIRKIIIAEGDTECAFLHQVLRMNGTRADVAIFCCEGVSKLSAKLGIIVGLPGFANISSIGLMFDCEADPAGRLQSIIRSMAVVGLPSDFAAFSTFQPFTSNGRTARVHMSPQFGTVGYIETLVLQELGQHAIGACGTALAACTAQAQNRALTDKAHAQALIACLTDGRYSTAAYAFQTGVLDVRHAAYRAAYAFAVAV